MSNDSWSEKVERGRALVSEINDRKWELGDLAVEVCPAGSNGIHNDGVLEKFATEIGIAVRTLRVYRLTSAAWPADTRVSAQTWTTHRDLMARDDRFDIIAEQTWTYNSLNARLGRLPNPSRVNKDTGEIVETPTAGAVREAIKADPTIAREAMKALDQRYDESPKPIAPRPSTTQDDGADLVWEFRNLHKGVDRIVQLVNDGKAVVSDSTRDSILREVKWLRTALGYIEDGVASDDLAAELASFLQEQA